MDILDEVRDDASKEKIFNFFQIYSNYFSLIIIVIFVGFVTFFWWDKCRQNSFLEDANKYSIAMSSKGNNKVHMLQKLKEKKNIYGDLAKLKLATLYFEKRNLNEAIHNYALISNSQNAAKLYRDYSQLMVIKIKILMGVISYQNGLKMYEDFYKNAKYFRNIAIVNESILAINNNTMSDISLKLNEILTDNEAPDSVLFFAKIINKK